MSAVALALVAVLIEALHCCWALRGAEQEEFGPALLNEPEGIDCWDVGWEEEER